MKNEQKPAGPPRDPGPAKPEKITRTDEEWRQLLTPEQYQVMREKATERPGTGEYLYNHDTGTYLCGACGQELFPSETKYESGCGWPSFYAPADESRIETVTDKSHGMIRTEIMCSRCGAHLGHVFDDGPNPTGQRYCVNSLSLKFRKAEE